MNSEEQKILDITVRYDDAVNGIAKYKESIENLEKAEKKLQEDFKNGQVTKKEYQRQMIANKEAVKEYKDGIRVLSKEIQNNLKREKEQEGSLKSLRAQLSNATRAYDELSRAERNGAKGKELQRHINEITTELKAAEEQTQRFYRNVGNYKQSIVDAIAGNNQFAKSLLSIGGGGGAGGAAGVGMGAAALATAGVAALAAGIYKLKEAINSGVNLIVSFEKESSTLAAMLNTTTDKTQRLTDDALRLGEATRYTAVEVTQLQIELAKLGFSQDEIINSTESVLMFANATGASLADAATVAGAALRVFGDEAKNMPRYVSAMAVATTKSALSFNDLSTSISTLGPVANAFGFEIEDVVTLMGKLRDSGFDASSAATATRNILLKLADANGDLAKSLGGPVTDMASLQKGLVSLKDSGIDLASALELTDKRSVAAFEAFLNQAKGLTALRDSVTDCEDGLKQMNDTMSNNVQGSLAKLESAWQGLLLKFYSSRGVMKMIVDGLTDFVSWCSKLGERFDDLKRRSLLVRVAFEGFMMNIRGTLQFIGETAKAILSILKGVGKALEGILTMDFSRMGEGIKEALLAIPKMVGNTGKNVAENFMTAFKNVVNKEKPKVEVEVEATGDVEVPAADDGGKNGKKFTKPKSEKELQAEKAAAEKLAKERAEQNKKEQEEMQKAEKLLLEIVEQGAEVRRKAIETEYNQKIETIRRRLNDEKNLTADAQKAMTSQMESLREIRDRKLAEFDVKAKNEEIKRETAVIENILSTVKKGSDEEYQLKMSKIEKERQLALNAASLEVMSEEEKSRLIWSVNEKYNKMVEEADKEHYNTLIQQQTEAIQKRYQEKILQAETSEDGGSELDVLRLQLEMRQELLENAQQKEGETLQDFNLRKLQLEKDYQGAKKALNDKEVQIEKAKYTAIAGLMGGLSDVAEAFGEENEGLAKAAKFLALGEIAVNTGVAISAGVKQAQSVPYPANLIAIATTVATVLANIATAIKTVKSAKFATGGDVIGPGTGTSDSVSARLSNGESVLTAQATQMFAPALSAFNQMGGGVPITAGQNGGGGQQVGEEFLANAVTKGMERAPRPVVSVEEINRVNNRLNTINQISVLE